MKNFLFAALMLIVNALHSQVLIHAHNDYEKKEPLFNAIRNKAFAIEADVYLVDGKLMVAHDRKDIRPERTLQAMYLDPLDSLFAKHKGSVSADKKYKPVLVVDIKSDGEKAIATLIAMISRHQKNFDRRVNPMAVEILISGDRGPVSSWRAYPAFIKFDGRPTEEYDIATLSRVLTISE
ncbi:MAG: glycerophosphodiester phosphodiesterase, partial [Chitinophagaceae bacterium]